MLVCYSMERNKPFSIPKTNHGYQRAFNPDSLALLKGQTGNSKIIEVNGHFSNKVRGDSSYVRNIHYFDNQEKTGCPRWPLLAILTLVLAFLATLAYKHWTSPKHKHELTLEPIFYSLMLRRPSG